MKETCLIPVIMFFNIFFQNLKGKKKCQLHLWLIEKPRVPNSNYVKDLLE